MQGAITFTRQADEAAIRAIMAKAVGPVFQFDWRDLSPEEHAASFVVAKAMRQDVLDLLAAAVRQAITEGRTPRQFAAELTPLLQKAGWWGRKEMTDPLTGEVRKVQLGSARRLDVIFDTNMRMAHAAGRWERFEAQAEAYPYLRYVAVQDGRTRQEHARWHGIILPVGHPFWRTHYPPNGWRCRCRVQQVSVEMMNRNRWRVTDSDALAQKMGEAGAAVNARTGAVEMVWPGVDPGFAHNAGVARMTVLARRLRRVPDDLSAAVQKGLPFDPPLPASPVPFKLDVGPRVLDGRLFSTMDDARDAAQALLAGAPSGLKLEASWAASTTKIVFEGHAGISDSFRIERSFYQRDGEWRVHHDWFKIGPEHRGGGHAKAMMRAAVALYDRLGVRRIEVQAALSDGALVWARLGFAPDSAEAARRDLIGWARAALDGDELAFMLDLVTRASDDELMWKAARAVYQGKPLGPVVLAGKSWYGHLDLNNADHRKRLMAALGPRP